MAQHAIRHAPGEATVRRRMSGGSRGSLAIRVNGLHFFTGTAWDPGNTYGNSQVTDGVAQPVGAYYGALPLIVGTALPVGRGI